MDKTRLRHEQVVKYNGKTWVVNCINSGYFSMWCSNDVVLVNWSDTDELLKCEFLPTEEDNAVDALINAAREGAIAMSGVMYYLSASHKAFQNKAVNRLLVAVEAVQKARGITEQ